jgi:hypothetical protein
LAESGYEGTTARNEAIFLAESLSCLSPTGKKEWRGNMDNFPKKNDCLYIFFVKFVGDAAQSGILISKNSKKFMHNFYRLLQSLQLLLVIKMRGALVV